MSTKLTAGRVRKVYEFIKAHRTAAQRAGDVSSARRGPKRLLRVARAASLRPGSRGCPAPSADPSVVHREPRHLRSARVFLDLREAGETCSKHRVARLMREHHLRALHGYRMRRWSVGKPSVLIPNLLQRQFTVTRRNRAWVTDITYIRTWQGWLYLAVVMDLFSRKIVGWSAGPTIHRELVLDAVLMAVRRRRPRGDRDPFGSRHAIRQRRLAALLPHQSPGAEHEPKGQLLGQCRRGVLLQQPEEGADQEADLQEPRAGVERCGRLHRSLLQSNPPSQSPRRREPRAV